MDHKTVERLEREIERAIAGVAVYQASADGRGTPAPTSPE